MNQLELSELCMGIVIKAKKEGLDLSGMFEPDTLSEPYNIALLDVPNMSMIELKGTYGFDAIGAAEAASALVDIEEASDYAAALAKSAVYADVGRDLSRIGKKLISGENGDTDKILRLAAKLDKGESGFVTMANIQKLDESDIWTPSHYEPIDANAGGLPKSGLTIVAGPAKLGKTTLLLKILAETARAGKRCAFFSLEMNKEVVTHRLKQVRPNMRKKDLDLIHVLDDPMREDRVYAESSRLVSEYKDIRLIAIDYARKMLQGRPASVESMSSIYASAGDLSKNLGIPVILIAGVSRGYVGGEPDVNHIWYSGLAEHEASLIILIHNPALLDVDMSSTGRKNLPYVEGTGYLKFGACRYGMKQGSLGAAQVKWNDKKGSWGDMTKEWYPRYAG